MISFTIQGYEFHATKEGLKYRLEVLHDEAERWLFIGYYMDALKAAHAFLIENDFIQE